MAPSASRIEIVNTLAIRLPFYRCPQICSIILDFSQVTCFIYSVERASLRKCRPLGNCRHAQNNEEGCQSYLANLLRRQKGEFNFRHYNEGSTGLGNQILALKPIIRRSCFSSSLNNWLKLYHQTANEFGGNQLGRTGEKDWGSPDGWGMLRCHGGYDSGSFDSSKAK